LRQLFTYPEILVTFVKGEITKEEFLENNPTLSFGIRDLQLVAIVFSLIWFAFVAGYFVNTLSYSRASVARFLEITTASVNRMARPEEMTELGGWDKSFAFTPISIEEGYEFGVQSKKNKSVPV